MKTSDAKLAHAEIEHLNAEINLLQSQVELIKENALGPPKISWYKQPSIIVSTIALAISLATTSVNWREDSHKQQMEDIHKKVDAVQQSALDLINVRQMMVNASTQSRDVQNNPTIQALYEARREITLSQVLNMLDRKEVEANITPSVFTLLANDELMASHYLEAKKFYEKILLNKQPTDIDSNTHRGLGQLYMSPNTTITNLKEGRRQFQWALDDYGDRKDGDALRIKGYLFQWWAQYEYQNNEIKRGDDLFFKAKETFASISDRWSRRSLLMELENTRLTAYQWTSFADSKVRRLKGNWKVAYESQPPAAGEMDVIEDGATGELRSEIRFVGPSSLTVITGIPRMRDEKTAIIELTNQIAGGGSNTPYSPIGVIMIHLPANSARYDLINGEYNNTGQAAPIRLTLKRTK